MRDGQKDYAISAFWSLLSSNSGMAHHVLIKKETTESALKRLSEGQMDKEKVDQASPSAYQIVPQLSNNKQDTNYEKYPFPSPETQGYQDLEEKKLSRYLDEDEYEEWKEGISEEISENQRESFLNSDKMKFYGQAYNTEEHRRVQ